MEEIVFSYPLPTKNSEIKVKVKKSPSAKSKSINCCFKGRTLMVTTPGKLDGNTQKKVVQQLNRNSVWIEQQVKSNPAILEKDLSFESPTFFHFKGKRCEVVWEKGHSSVNVKVDEEQKKIVIGYNHMSKIEAVKKRLAEMFEDHLLREINVYLKKWLPTIPGGSIQQFRIAPVGYAWGSMTSKHHLLISFNLAFATPKAIEYIIIHELCHQIYLDHSHKFWSQVQKRMINYKEHEKYLKTMGPMFITKSELILKRNA